MASDPASTSVERVPLLQKDSSAVVEVTPLKKARKKYVCVIASCDFLLSYFTNCSICRQWALNEAIEKIKNGRFQVCLLPRMMDLKRATAQFIVCGFRWVSSPCAGSPS